MTFEVPDHVRPVRDAVLAFMVDHVEPAEAALFAGGPDAADLLAGLQARAKDEGLWALGHPVELGGGGLPFLDYVFVNEVQGRSELGQVALGTFTLQDTLMLQQHASPRWRDEHVAKLAAAEEWPSFAMTEPGISSSDPTQLRSRAWLDGDEWVVDAHKWFTTGANRAAFTTVMCRTEPDAPDHRAFSMIVVPTGAPGYEIVRETPVLGIRGGHCEIRLDHVRVPADHLVGERGRGFHIAQERLGPGRIFHCMRWLGQAQRAFDLLCARLHDRSAFGGPLADKQLMQAFVFESYAQIQACRMLTLQAAERIDSGSSARVEIGVIKVVGARMLHDVIDRAVQAYGAEGLTDDTPLSHMYRAARFGRIYDGPDEVHIHTTARRILRAYEDGGTWQFAR